jgi:hypothetical protein
LSEKLPHSPLVSWACAKILRSKEMLWYSNPTTLHPCQPYVRHCRFWGADTFRKQALGWHTEIPKWIGLCDGFGVQASQKP